MEKRWKKLQSPEEKVLQIYQALKISPILCSILVQREIDSYESAKKYFRPQLSDLHDPWLMKDMDKAVARVMDAIDRQEKILVFGDYDVDGTTAVACLYQFLHEIGHEENVDFYIPHRYREGYGISKQGIDFAKSNGFSLVISLDCGIKSVDLIAYAQSLEIDFIVCDHHLPGRELPAAVAILNPKQEGCPYPYKDLCGCGVGFKLITALAQRKGVSEDRLWNYLDLVATAIAADIVPITGENRVLAFYGLKQVNENPAPGIKALIQLSGLQKSLHINNLVFIIAPRVNAAGRMDDARKAVLLFIEKDFQKSLGYAEMLHDDNTERKEADSSITEEALAIIYQNEILSKRKSTVVFQPHWHKGVVGIVASRLIEHYYRPTIVLTQSGNIVAGSARSIPGFNIHEGLHSCKDLLLGFGGHYFAAGMTMLPENVASFSDRFEQIVAQMVPDELLVPEIIIHAEVRFRDLTPSFYSILNQMEPFGPENMRPVFISRKVADVGWSKIVKEDHIRFVLKQDDIVFKGIGFNLAHKFHLLGRENPLDIVFTLDENEWNGEKHLQLKIMDLRPSE
jgi:single-stranded-DNA-specific exonuclease